MKRVIFIFALLGIIFNCYAVRRDFYVDENDGKFGFYYFDEKGKKKFIVPCKYLVPDMVSSYDATIYARKGYRFNDVFYGYTQLVLFDGDQLIFFSPEGKIKKKFGSWVDRFMNIGIVSTESGVYDAVNWKLISEGRHPKVSTFQVQDFETGEKQDKVYIFIESEDKSHFRLFQSLSPTSGYFSENEKTHQSPTIVNDVRYTFCPSYKSRLIRDRFLVTGEDSDGYRLCDMATGQCDNHNFFFSFPIDSLVSGSTWLDQNMITPDLLLVSSERYYKEDKRYGAINLATGKVTPPIYSDVFTLTAVLLGKDHEDYVNKAVAAMNLTDKTSTLEEGVKAFGLLIADSTYKSVPLRLRQAVEDYASRAMLQMADSALIADDDLERARMLAQRSATLNNPRGQAYMGFLAETFDNDTIAAIEWYKAAAESHYPDAIYRLAILAYESGLYELSFPALKDAVNRLLNSELSYPFRLYLAQSYRLGLGTPVDAWEYYLTLNFVANEYEPIQEEIRSHLPEMLQNLEKYNLSGSTPSYLWGMLSNVSPENPHYHYMAAKTYEDLRYDPKNDKFGIKKKYIAGEYKAAHDLEPDNSEYTAAFNRYETVIDYMEGKVSVSKARQLISEGKYKEALDMLNQALSIIPDVYAEPIDAYVAMAECYFEMGNDNMAIAAAKRALDKQSYNSDALRIHNLAVNRINQRTISNASSIAQMLEASAQFMQATSNLTNALSKRKNKSESSRVTSNKSQSSSSGNTNITHSSSTSSSSNTKWVEKKCTFCGGDGISPMCKYATRFPGNPQEYCKKCQRFDDLHHHETCPSCKGKGYVRLHK